MLSLGVQKDIAHPTDALVSPFCNVWLWQPGVFAPTELLDITESSMQESMRSVTLKAMLEDPRDEEGGKVWATMTDTYFAHGSH